jgi:ABC-type glycerol-3-phosphate transport system substrate-binding protein
MSDKVYQSVSGATVIVDGGDPLPGCPASWDEAHEWADRVNKDGNKSEVPFWSWDCGFKLDFDGPLVSVSSRFYPPKSHYGPTWDGSVAISVLGNPVITKSFDCKTLDELKKSVETFALGFAKALEQALESTESKL